VAAHVRTPSNPIITVHREAFPRNNDLDYAPYSLALSELAEEGIVGTFHSLA
jgi:hypothetical protein